MSHGVPASAGEGEVCFACGHRRPIVRLLERVLSTSRAVLLGGGLVGATLVLGAAMQPPHEPPAPACDVAALAPSPSPEPGTAGPPRTLADRGATAALLAAARRAPADGVVAVSPVAKLVARGDAAYRAGKFDLARRRYLLAAWTDRRSVDAHFGLALARFELFDDAGARRALHRSLRLNPGHALSHLLLGFVEQTEGQDALARHHYEQYLAHEPDGAFAGEVRAILAG